MPGLPNILDVAVHCNPELQEVTIDQSSITLTNDSDYVVWGLEDLPSGASASILFGDGGSGPFQAMVLFEDQLVGAGNQGPGATAGANFYSYHVQIQPAEGAPWSASGLVINQATVAKTVPLNGDPVVPEACGWPPRPQCPGT